MKVVVAADPSCSVVVYKLPKPPTVVPGLEAIVVGLAAVVSEILKTNSEILR